MDLWRPARVLVRRAYGSAFSDHEIEDLYGNAWLGTLRALEHRQAELDDEEIRRYILTAVAHHASKELRRRRRRPTAPFDQAYAIADTGAEPDERAAGREESKVARDLLGSLPPRRRAVMLLRYGWGLEPRQVCSLVSGLSPRAYRKEITRGIDELTEKMRLVERGDWCADREPILKAYVSGLADADQQRQARHHLAHCRPCIDFVSRLNGHLHDVGTSLVVSGAVDGIREGPFTLLDRLGDMLSRLRDGVGGHVADADQASADTVGAAVASARGAGAVGTGVLAKLAAFGSTGKLAAVCLGGGVAATMCLAAGIAPLQLRSPPVNGAPQVIEELDRAAPSARSSLTASSLYAAVDHVESPAAPATTPSSQTTPPEPAPEDTPLSDTTTTPIAVGSTTSTTTYVPPPPEPAEQQFGPAEGSSTSSTGASSSRTSASSGGTSTRTASERPTAVASEFGP